VKRQIAHAPARSCEQRISQHGSKLANAMSLWVLFISTTSTHSVYFVHSPLRMVDKVTLLHAYFRQSDLVRQCGRQPEHKVQLSLRLCVSGLIKWPTSITTVTL